MTFSLSELVFKGAQRIEGYLIEKPLASGGMAEVFQAGDLALDKRVLTKVLGPPGFRKGT